MHSVTERGRRSKSPYYSKNCEGFSKFKYPYSRKTPHMSNRMRFPGCLNQNLWFRVELRWCVVFCRFLSLGSSWQTHLLRADVYFNATPPAIKLKGSSFKNSFSDAFSWILKRLAEELNGCVNFFNVPFQMLFFFFI